MLITDTAAVQEWGVAQLRTMSQMTASSQGNIHNEALKATKEFHAIGMVFQSA